MKIGKSLKSHEPNHVPNHSHAWRGAWGRPMKMDEDDLHPFDVARMTDHNVRGVDMTEEEYENSSKKKAKMLAEWENEGGAPFRYGF